MKRGVLARAPQFDEAYITSMIKYGEADAIVRLFSAENGRLSAFCRRAQKPSKSRGGMIQVPSRARVGFVVNPRKDLVNLVQVDIASSTFLLTSRLKSFSWFCYLSEIVEVFLPEQEPARQIFTLLEEAHKLLGAGFGDVALLRGFELKLLQHCGYLASFDDVIALRQNDLPKHLQERAVELLRQDVLSFDLVAKKVAKRLLEEPLGSVTDIDLPALKLIGRIFVSHLRAVKQSPLRSVGVIKDLGV